MSNLKEQKIVVVCDFSERMKEAIVHGVRLADILKLCLTAIWKNKEQKARLQEKLINATQTIKQNVPDMRVSSLLIKNSLLENLDKLTWDYDAVLIVIHQADTKLGLKAFRESSIAFVFVNGDAPEFLNYKNVLIPLDYRKASKETALWASFFGRFNRSLVQVIYAHETNKEDAANLMKNLNFLQKFLSNLNVACKVVAGKSSSWGICNETISNASKLNGDVMVFAGSSYISLIDLLIGLPEKRIIQSREPAGTDNKSAKRDLCDV